MDVGEIQCSDSSFNISIHQVVQRAKLLKWAMPVVRPETTTFCLVGHIYVPKAGCGDELVQQIDCILDDVKFQVHTL